MVFICFYVRNLPVEPLKLARLPWSGLGIFCSGPGTEVWKSKASRSWPIVGAPEGLWRTNLRPPLPPKNHPEETELIEITFKQHNMS